MNDMFNKGLRPTIVKRSGVGVVSDDRSCVLLTLNGAVYSMHAIDAKHLFELGVKTVNELCGSHAIAPNAPKEK